MRAAPLRLSSSPPSESISRRAPHRMRGGGRLHCHATPTPRRSSTPSQNIAERRSRPPYTDGRSKSRSSASGHDHGPMAHTHHKATRGGSCICPPPCSATPPCSFSPSIPVLNVSSAARYEPRAPCSARDDSTGAGGPHLPCPALHPAVRLPIVQAPRASRAPRSP